MCPTSPSPPAAVVEGGGLNSVHSRTRMKVLAAAIAIVLASCATHDSRRNHAEGSILEGDEARKVLDQCSHYGPAEATSIWRPSSDDLYELESRLPKFLKHQELHPPGSLQGYYRQYVGVVVDSRRLIYVNAFPKESIAADVAALQQFKREHPEVNTKDPRDFPESMRSLDGWRSHAVIVCDGGSSYWGVLYDPSIKRFITFTANGVG
jgi:hypothetical protein